MDAPAAVDTTGVVAAVAQCLLVDGDDELGSAAATADTEHEIGEPQRLEEFVAQQRVVGGLGGVFAVEPCLGRAAERFDERDRSLGVEAAVDVPHAVAPGPGACADVSSLALQPVGAVVAFDLADRCVEAGAELLGGHVCGESGEL